MRPSSCLNRRSCPRRRASEETIPGSARSPATSSVGKRSGRTLAFPLPSPIRSHPGNPWSKICSEPVHTRPIPPTRKSKQLTNGARDGQNTVPNCSVLFRLFHADPALYAIRLAGASCWVLMSSMGMRVEAGSWGRTRAWLVCDWPLLVTAISICFEERFGGSAKIRRSNEVCVGRKTRWPSVTRTST